MGPNTCLPIFLCVVSSLFAPSKLPAQSSGEQEFVIGCWSAPRGLDVPFFAWLKENGFTHALYWRSQQIAREQWAADLREAERHNIKLVFDSWQPAAAPGEWVRAVLETAASSPSFAGIYAPDEPGYRFPLEGSGRRPSESSFAEAFAQVSGPARDVFCCDAVFASDQNVRRFLPFCSVFGLDIYPFRSEKRGRRSWTEPVEAATRKALQLAEKRPVWMVLQGHGRKDWYAYATERLKLQIPLETGDRPSQAVLIDMGLSARKAGALGVWWWSFELYDWQIPDHREFIASFRHVNLRVREAADKESASGMLRTKVLNKEGAEGVMQTRWRLRF
ncbi:MAG: hypothetical protein ACE15E_03730 [Acidobacteriota bacterium]